MFTYPTTFFKPNQVIDPNTKFLLPCTGPNASTTFTDFALGGFNPHVMVPNDNAQIDAVSLDPFGGNAGVMLLDGTNDWVSTIDAADLDPDGQIFTIEMWIQTLDSARVPPIGKYAGSNLGWYVDLNVSAGKLFVFFGDGTNYIIKESTVNVNTGSWIYITTEFQPGSLLDIWVNGIKGSSTFASSGTVNSVASSHLMKIGARTLGSPTNDFNGKQAGFRISKGIQRYPGNFTPPVGLLTPYQ